MTFSNSQYNNTAVVCFDGPQYFAAMGNPTAGKICKMQNERGAENKEENAFARDMAMTIFYFCSEYCRPILHNCPYT